ncbi:unnamed protein product [Nesidiocoris tenuis]|uniref:Uncharacterized protein n=1 Tax=Nesidiocoris tenuis TaxID=355587 RepID=A0A6H5GNM1_9HEMI|nr:unnamed protein product [Nesidiocoris tenuis]
MPMSGTAYAFWAFAYPGDARIMAFEYAKRVGCKGDNSTAVLGCLKKRPVSLLVQGTAQYFGLWDLEPTRHLGPVSEARRPGAMTPPSPKQWKPVDLPMMVIEASGEGLLKTLHVYDSWYQKSLPAHGRRSKKYCVLLEFRLFRRTLTFAPYQRSRVPKTHVPRRIHDVPAAHHISAEAQRSRFGGVEESDQNGRQLRDPWRVSVNSEFLSSGIQLRKLVNGNRGRNLATTRSLWITRVTVWCEKAYQPKWRSSDRSARTKSFTAAQFENWWNNGNSRKG